ncbi:MAG: cyclodeaminase/cyclohydrolase family protein [Treponema sp.]|jgi:formiminotetrahydrofolate cyclodeaminase|nr:cyclodeaminase/cyclohydrolase family protein [Treponema sp.]
MKKALTQSVLLGSLVVCLLAGCATTGPSADTAALQEKDAEIQRLNQRIDELSSTGETTRIPFSELSCADFVAALGSKASVPGGGGASALVGAVGVALGNMVADLTIGKKRYADVEAEMQSLKADATRLQDELLALIQRDADVFEPLMQAYRLPEATDAERADKARVMEAALRDACSVPLEIMRKSAAAIVLLETAASKGYALALSDAGAGAAFCKAALSGASLTVYINTKAMTDRAYAEHIDAEADALLAEYAARADQVLVAVKQRLME